MPLSRSFPSCHRLLGIFLLLGLVASGSFYLLEMRFLRRATSATGYVTRIGSIPRSRQLHITYHANGVTRHFTEGIGLLPSLLHHFQVGQAVSVLHNPELPPYALLNITLIKHQRSLSALAGVFLLGLIVVVALRFAARRASNDPPHPQ